MIITKHIHLFKYMQFYCEKSISDEWPTCIHHPECLSRMMCKLYTMYSLVYSWTFLLYYKRIQILFFKSNVRQRCTYSLRKKLSEKIKYIFSFSVGNKARYLTLSVFEGWCASYIQCIAVISLRNYFLIFFSLIRFSSALNNMIITF